MTTIKLKYNSSLEFQDFLFKLRKQYSCVYRFAYNRLFDGFTKKEIYHKILKLNNIELIKSRMINDAIDFSSRLYEKDKKSSHKSIFGSKNNFIQRLRNKISKEEMIEQLTMAIWHYAKRQNTWLKRDKNSKWFKAGDYRKIEDIVKKFIKDDSI